MQSVEAIKHVKTKIANSKIYNKPFTFFYVKDIFPIEYYSLILRYWPHKSLFADIVNEGRLNVVGKGYAANSRRIIQHNKLCQLENVSPQAASFWRSFSEVFYGRDFNRFLFDHFKPFIKAQRGDLPKQFHLDTDGLLVQDDTHYAIGPHTDSPRRLVSTLYYCPDDASRRHLGTSIFIPNPNCPPLQMSGKHHPFSSFKKVGTAGYKPNCMFGFVVSPNSFHGVEPISDVSPMRRSILHYVKMIPQSR